MVNPWALAIPLILIAIVAYRWFKRERHSGEAVLVAHTLPGRVLPRYRARIRQLRIATFGSFVLLAAVAVSSAVMVARPHTVETRAEELASRDIVLCLDVSGSVIGFDSEVMKAFASMVDEFQGERVALVIWNSNSQVVFPLTDDYDLVKERLNEGAEALETDGYSDYPTNPQEFYDFTAGTFLESTGGASLVGDGLANCVMQFDMPEEERARTIILATDNEVSTPEVQIYSLSEAVEMASEQSIVIHGMYIETYYGSVNYESQEMRDEIEGAGGYYFVAGDEEAASQLLDEIESQQAEDLESDPVTILVDTPGAWPIIAAVGIGILVVVGWRYRI